AYSASGLLKSSSPNSVGFCVTEVKVNGRIALDETNSSAFEVDLKSYDLSIGDKVEIQIFHKEGCIPKVLNPEVLKPKSTYEIIAMSADKEGTLKWTTKAETGKLSFYIEQFRWNKWVRVGELEGAGKAVTNEYVFKVSPHSGKNQLRLRQTDYTSIPRLSKTLEFTSDAPEVDFSPIKASKEITFFMKGKDPSKSPTETMYEVYDQYGNIVKKGSGVRLDVSNLPKGSYFINFDNKMGEFVKK
ncbi:MAG: T9SS C-terminal target domain-containing protein, partial [Sphingobacteriia bacterium]|nr:T9SS C-terminal target domain-containing protein [Sphingobacteriia bacterium]